MDYKKALELKEKNNHLIGMTYNKSPIEELIIVPSNKEPYDLFIKDYLRNGDAEKSIIPFTNESVTILAIFNKTLQVSQNTFSSTDFRNLANQLPVILK